MNTRNILKGGLIGLGLNTAALAVFWVSSAITGLPFVPFTWFEWLSRILPGSVITTGIESMVSVIRAFNIGPTSSIAKLAEQGMAILFFLAAGLVLGAIAASIHRRNWQNISLGSFLAALVIFVISSLALFQTASDQRSAVGGSALALWVALMWSVVFPRLYFTGRQRPETPSPAEMQERRTFLRWLFAGAAGLGTLLVGYSPGLRRQVPVTGAGTPIPTFPLTPAPVLAGSPTMQPASDGRIAPAPGTRPELTATKDFYRIDINLSVPHIDAASWNLKITGLIDQPIALTLDDIHARPAVKQIATMSCISNYLGGDLIGTAEWTGIRVKDLLADIKVKPEAGALLINADDGFFEYVPIAEAMDERTLLVFEMNGEPLPAEHGFPLRIYIPNHYGMKQPKWIRSIEVVEKESDGYWVVRGWDHKAIPQTTSVVDAIDVDMPENGLIPIGGIAWAGARGISKVEVNIDEGEWVPAELRIPALSQLAWVQWRYDWPAQSGSHLVSVRAVDGTGEPQKEYYSEPHPSGSTGIHNKRFMVS